MPSAASTDIESRKLFLGLTQADLDELAALRPVLDKRASDFVAAFYRHLLGFDGPRRLLADEAVRDRLLQSQREYFLDIADPVVDAAYAERRTRIGRAHEVIGLGPQWYVGAYGLYLRELAAAVAEVSRGDLARERALRATVEKRLLLDMELAMETYIDKREEQLAFLNRELAEAQRGLEREVDEQREELRETTQRARAAEQLASVGVLAAGLAHEIGTPMGVIRGHAESLESAVSDDRSRWRVRTIVEQIDRITNIMQALLNLARPRAPVVEPVALAEVVSNSAGFLHEKLSRRGIEVEGSLDDSVVVQGDTEKLQQLFLNLLLNAADAMPSGGNLRLRVARDAATGEAVAEIEDDGVGMEAAVVDQLFTPFFTTKEAGQGNGLGLVVARGIAIDHGGDIAVDSAPGSGTTFAVRIPLDAAPRA